MRSIFHGTTVRESLAAAAAIIAATVSVLICTAILGASLADASSMPANPVGLQDAHVAPVFLRYLSAHGTVSRTRQCGAHGYWTEFSAYTWQGKPLPAQRWTTGPFPVYAWGRVTFDGLTFTNGYSVPVLVAAWCS